MELPDESLLLWCPDFSVPYFKRKESTYLLIARNTPPARQCPHDLSNYNQMLYFGLCSWLEPPSRSCSLTLQSSLLDPLSSADVLRTRHWTRLQQLAVGGHGNFCYLLPDERERISLSSWQNDSLSRRFTNDWHPLPAFSPSTRS